MGNLKFILLAVCFLFASLQFSLRAENESNDTTIISNNIEFINHNLEIIKKRLNYSFPGKFRLVENIDDNFREFSIELFN